MSRKRIIVEELDDGSFSYQEQDLSKAQQTAQGQVIAPMRDGARESKKDMVKEFAHLIGYKEYEEGKE